MSDPPGAFQAFTIALVLVTPFLVFLRGRLWAFVAGATPVALAVILIEGVVQNAAGPVYGPSFVLVMFALLTEGVLKFGVSGATGGGYRFLSVPETVLPYLVYGPGGSTSLWTCRTWSGT